ncbi:hypothetical protein B0O99DRAFT_393718 [Bisporella sp. PMI_857]|nr:hypothetical protein B0O99DRAFT_393718 [Bisporella sp. PMI_857]
MMSVCHLLLARAHHLPYIRCRITPLAKSRIIYLWSANLTLHKRILSSSTMDPKFSTGKDGSKLMAETKTLLRDGWALDEKQIGVEKKYYFKTYTKCVVGLPFRYLQLHLKALRTSF